MVVATIYSSFLFQIGYKKKELKPGTVLKFDRYFWPDVEMKNRYPMDGKPTVKILDNNKLEISTEGDEPRVYEANYPYLMDALFVKDRFFGSTQYFFGYQS